MPKKTRITLNAVQRAQVTGLIAQNLKKFSKMNYAEAAQFTTQALGFAVSTSAIMPSYKAFGIAPGQGKSPGKVDVGDIDKIVKVLNVLYSHFHDLETSAEDEDMATAAMADLCTRFGIRQDI